MSHLNGFQILISFYILQDCISEVSDWSKIFHWFVREFKIVDDVMSTIIWVCQGHSSFWEFQKPQELWVLALERKDQPSCGTVFSPYVNSVSYRA